jgi:hypothetical protein
MLASSDHQQIVDAGGALDLTFASGKRGRQVANVKSILLAAFSDFFTDRLYASAIRLIHPAPG